MPDLLKISINLIDLLFDWKHSQQRKTNTVKKDRGNVTGAFSEEEKQGVA
jgi:hypothetical protein